MPVFLPSRFLHTVGFLPRTAHFFPFFPLSELEILQLQVMGKNCILEAQIAAHFFHRTRHAEGVSSTAPALGPLTTGLGLRHSLLFQPCCLWSYDSPRHYIHVQQEEEKGAKPAVCFFHKKSQGFSRRTSSHFHWSCIGCKLQGVSGATSSSSLHSGDSAAERAGMAIEFTYPQCLLH